MQEKERERKGKNGKIIKVAGCSPIREDVYKRQEDREAYILSLRQCQDEESNQLFLLFMAGQLKKSLSLDVYKRQTTRTTYG